MKPWGEVLSSQPNRALCCPRVERVDRRGGEAECGAAMGSEGDGLVEERVQCAMGWVDSGADGGKVGAAREGV